MIEDITTTTTFYLDSYNSITGCSSASRATAIVRIEPLPSPPIAQEVLRCGGGEATITATMGPNPGTEIRLYNTEFDEVILARDVSSPFILVTPSVSTTTTFYLSTVRGNCESLRQAAVVNVRLEPSSPLTENVIRCGTGIVTFTARMGGIPGTEVRLFTSPNNLTPIALATNEPYRLTVPNLTTTTTFYMAAVSILPEGICISDRIPVIATINPNPSVPSATNVFRCGAGPVTFTINRGNTTVGEVRFYEQPSGGSAIGTADGAPAIFTTGVLTTHTTYFVANAIGVCESPRIRVVANIRPQPGAISLSPVVRCGVGPATFTVEVASFQNTDIRLYDSPEGGSLVAVANVFPYRLTVPLVTTTTTFYATNYLDDCESARVEAIVNVVSNPVAPRASNVNRCGSGSVTFTVEAATQPGLIISLYSTTSQGTPLASTSTFPYFLEINEVITTTTYYLEARIGECSSTRSSTVATISPAPSSPQLVAQSRCGSGLITITAQMGNVRGNEIRFFDTNGNLLAIDNTEPYTFTTSINSGIQTFFATASLPACESPRASIEVSAGIVPTPPQASNFERCGSGRVITLTATMGLIPGREIRLYDKPQGGGVIAIATSEPYLLTIPNVATGTTTFYLSSAINTAEGTCESTRTPVTVTINPSLLPPVVRTESRCGEGRVVFTVSHANSSNVEVRLYTQLTASIPIQIERGQNLFITSPFINATTTFYFSTFANGCESERVSVTAVILPVPSLPASQDVFLCGSGSATFTVIPGAVPATEYHLYASEESQLPVAIATQAPFRLTVPFVSTTTTYYIQAVNNTSLGRCSSSKVLVRAAVGQVLRAASIPLQNSCGASIFSFNLNPENINGVEIRIYTNAQSNIPISVLNQNPYIFTTPLLTTSTTYFYNTSLGGCQSNRVAFEAIVTPLPPTPLIRSSASNICGSASVTFTIQALQGNTTGLRLYDSVGRLIETFNAREAIYVASLTTTTTFFVSALNGNCEGSREGVVVISSRTPAPEPKTFATCAGQTVSFTIEDLTPNREYRLYPDITSTSVVALANLPPYTITTPAIQTNTTFYLTNFENNCESSRVPITVNSTLVPSAPSASSERRCGAGAITISAAMGSLAGTSMRLYDAARGGNLVDVANSFPYIFTVTPPVIGTFTYYVSAAIGNCESSRVPVVVSAGQEPSAPIVQEQFRCGAGSLSFTVLMGNIKGESIQVYDTPQGGAPIATLQVAPYIFVTPTLSNTTTYYFASIGQGCVSSRVAAVATITPQPSEPLALPACGNEQVIFTVSSGSVAGEEFRLYTQPTGNVAPIIAVPSTQNRIVVNNPTQTTYYLSAANSRCESQRVRVERIIGVSPIISFNTSAESCFNFGSITASASAGAGGYAYELYQGNTLIATNRTGEFTAIRGGVYRLVVRDGNGCFAEVNARVASIPTPVFTSNPTVTSSTATINWSAVPGAQNYILQYRALPDGTFTTLPPIRAEQTGITITGLQPNALYEARVQAVCTGGRNSDFSPPISFQTSDISSTSCSSPTRLRADVAVNTATLSWEAVNGAIGYNILYQRLPDGAVQQVTNLSSTTFILRDLVENTEYAFQVQAVCRGGLTSAFSARQVFVTGNTSAVCAIPQNVRAEAGINEILVLWNAVPNAVSYTLQYRELPGGAPQLVTGITSTNYLIGNLEGEKTYEVRVRANCSSGIFSEYSQGVAATVRSGGSGNCGIPTGLSVSFRPGNVAFLSWQPVTNALCYIVSVGIKGQPTDTWIDYLVPAPGTSLEVFNLIPGREYSARIRSNCSLCSIRTGLRSSFSGILDFTMPLARQDLEAIALREVEAYPNPNTGIFQVYFNKSKDRINDLQFKVIDMSARVVLKRGIAQKVTENSWLLDVRNLEPGVYIVELIAGDGVERVRIVKN
ncbi:MAG: fibronectin type III domain-containing protein [Bacteroidia bacterium]|nr:fibronectin type III domain-containing protein [Bacteroidia bacterium]